MATLDISGRVRVGSGVSRFFTAFKEAMRETFGRRKLEDIILASHKARFEPAGRSAVAQKTPDRLPWAPITEYTLANRKKNKNPAQALVDTGALRDAIQIIRSSLRQVVNENTRRARARVGVPTTSPQYLKGQRMNFGYTKKGRGGVDIVIPAREFIGIDPRTLTAVGRFVDRAFGRVAL